MEVIERIRTVLIWAALIYLFLGFTLSLSVFIRIRKVIWEAAEKHKQEPLPSVERFFTGLIFVVMGTFTWYKLFTKEGR